MTSMTSDASNKPAAYVRDDGAQMVEVAPHVYVSRKNLGLIR